MIDEKKKRSRVGIKEIAELANLSKTAVSYALNGTGRLDDETRARVIAIAEQHGYRANPFARKLRGKSFGVLAVFASVPSSMSEVVANSDYFVRLWQGAVTCALARGYMLLLAPFGTGPDMLRNMPIDGGIVIDPVQNDPTLAHLNRNGLAAVTIGRDLRETDGGALWIDSPHGELATRLFDLFEAQGARRVGAILSSPAYSYTLAVRDAYLAWTRARKQTPLLVEIESHPSESAGYEAAMQMLAAPSPPDAIFASLDRLAAGVFLAAQRRGIAVPEALMIAAGTDGTESRSAAVPITALDLKPEALGSTAVSKLIARLEGDEDAGDEMLTGDVLLRATTARRSI
ncbi:hypothetical protein BZM27_24130 [Paraburkholderia steynii]|uniref:HTH lacI-type domain-containing protein n=1 Tax=Paraburkholderia steynii TaxID=1245441 RepID=A0A4R0X9F5_9BURK|nr:hypothetical protein BZM27_24130 [Paraburkholderia steynii]